MQAAMALVQFLLQKFDGVFCPNAYAGPTVAPTERKYSVTKEGCLEIVFALKTFDMYLDSQTFTTQTYQHVSSGWNF